MPEVEVTGAFHQGIMVASEPAWPRREDSSNVAEALHVCQETDNSVGSTICAGTVLYSET